MHYLNNFICPYYSYDKKGFVKCEAGRIAFPFAAVSNGYFDNYCRSFNWQNCTLAKALNEKYEKEK